MDRIESISAEFVSLGCSVIRGALAGVDCLTVAANGRTLLVLIGDPNSAEGRRAVNLWRDQCCWCADRATASAIGHCLRSGEFDAD